MTARSPVSFPLTLDGRVLTVQHAELVRSRLGAAAVADLAAVEAQLVAVQALSTELQEAIVALVPRLKAPDGLYYRLVFRSVDEKLVLDWEVEA